MSGCLAWDKEVNGVGKMSVRDFSNGLDNVPGGAKDADVGVAFDQEGDGTYVLMFTRTDRLTGKSHKITVELPENTKSDSTQCGGDAVEFGRVAVDGAEQGLLNRHELLVELAKRATAGLGTQ